MIVFLDTSIGRRHMDGLVRLRFITERFKSSDRTLLFYTPVSAPIIPVAFSDILKKLGDRVIEHVALHQEPFIQAFGGLKIDAFCDSAVASKRGCSGINLIGDEDKPCFQWKCDPDTWLDFACLVDVLVRSKGGHQYLRATPSEDILVMVSRGEYFDEGDAGTRRPGCAGARLGWTWGDVDRLKWQGTLRVSTGQVTLEGRCDEHRRASCRHIARRGSHLCRDRAHATRDDASGNQGGCPPRRQLDRPQSVNPC